MQGIIVFLIKCLLFLVQLPVFSFQSNGGEVVIHGKFFVLDSIQDIHINNNLSIKIGVPIDGRYYNAKYLDNIVVDPHSMNFTKVIQIDQPSLIFVHINNDRQYNIYVEPEAEINLRIKISHNRIIGVEDMGSLHRENNFLLPKLVERRPIEFRLMRYAQQFNESDNEFKQQFLDSCRMNLDYYLSSIDSLSGSAVISPSFIELAKAQLTYNALSVPFHQLLNQPTVPSGDVDRSFSEAVDTFFSWIGALDSIKLSINCPIYYSVYVDGPNLQPKNPLDYPDFKGYSRRVVLPVPFDRLAIFNALTYEYHNGSPTLSFRKAFQHYADVFPKDGLYSILDSLNNLISIDTISYQYLGNNISDSLRTYSFIMDEEGSVKDSYMQPLQNFEELIKSSGTVQRKLWFVDFWATWCKPCVEEFQYNQPLVDSLRIRGVGILYLSIDNKDKLRQWENIVRTNGLRGNHYLLSKDMQRHVRDKLNLQMIPRYMLVDDNGQIVLDDVGRPSNLLGLIEQIDNVLDRQ